MFKKQKSVSGVLTLNFTPKKGVAFKRCGWIKTARYDCLVLLKRGCFLVF
ncbi:hypothetical protein HPLT_04520 [Helicobacter pylori Lithuania75]|nr:hypothetical protein HPLT_04520 [Helicobacter pylori Lithuania75]